MGYKELAAAIRKGASMRPVYRGSPFGPAWQGRFWWRKQVMGSCAIGAALEAVHGDKAIAQCEEESWVTVFLRTFPFVSHPVLTAIYRRNDSGRNTREEIADWLDSLEAAPGRITTEEFTREFIARMTEAVSRGDTAETAKA